MVGKDNLMQWRAAIAVHRHLGSTAKPVIDYLNYEWQSVYRNIVAHCVPQDLGATRMLRTALTDG